MINFYFTGFVKVVLAFIFAFLQSDAAAAHTSILTVGDEVDGMTLTTGAADARPLWVFCASDVSENVTTTNCRVPQISKLAIGHVFLGRENVFSGTEWSELKWELYIDDQYIDLNQFGTYDYVLPAMAPNPSLVREVFMKFTAWDIVLTNLQPGAHTIDGRVVAGAEEFSWVVNLVIEEKTLTEWASRQEGEKSGGIRIRSHCPQMGNMLSRSHGSCRLYI
ncbi:MAG TPA: hypothetical protein VJ821_09655 [Anaerolineales bacterium]|nr:hypothetical protein [Anaerolineales bacterium]